jgi:hypothetical protein
VPLFAAQNINADRTFRKYRLNFKAPSHGLDEAAQRAQIHVSTFSIFEMALWFEALGRAFFRFFSSAKDFFADDALRGLLQIFIEGFFDCDEFRP